MNNNQSFHQQLYSSQLPSSSTSLSPHSLSIDPPSSSCILKPHHLSTCDTNTHFAQQSPQPPPPPPNQYDNYTTLPVITPPVTPTPPPLNEPSSLLGPSFDFYNNQTSHLFHAISSVDQWNAQPHLATARLNHLSLLLNSYTQQQVAQHQSSLSSTLNPPPHPLPPHPSTETPFHISLSPAPAAVQSNNHNNHHNNNSHNNNNSSYQSSSGTTVKSLSSTRRYPHLSSNTKHRYFSQIHDSSDNNNVIPEHSMTTDVDSTAKAEANAVAGPELFCIDSMGDGTQSASSASTSSKPKYRSIEWRPPPEKKFQEPKSTLSDESGDNLMINVTEATQARRDIKALCEKTQRRKRGHDDDQTTLNTRASDHRNGETPSSSSRRGSRTDNNLFGSVGEKRGSDKGLLPSPKRRRPLLRSDDDDEGKSEVCEKPVTLETGVVEEIVKVTLEPVKGNVQEEVSEMQLAPSALLDCLDVIDISSTPSSSSRESLRDDERPKLVMDETNDGMKIGELGKVTFGENGEIGEGDINSVEDADLEKISEISEHEDETEEPNNEEFEDGAASPIRVTEIVHAIGNSVKALKPEEVERELLWCLWELQESLGEQFPSCLKPISEPPLSARPLHSLRYTSTEPDSRIKLPRNYWSSRTQIYDISGNVIVNPDELRHIRTTLSCPCILPSSPPSPNNEDESNNDALSRISLNSRGEFKLEFCRLCGSPTCDARVMRGRCRQARCARCCQAGHNARRCRQGNPELWNDRYLNHLELSYRASLRDGMLLEENAEVKPSCITCGKDGHACCEFKQDEKTSQLSGERFRIINREEIIRDLAEQNGYRDNGLRWDFESAMCHVDPIRQSKPSRYSIRDWDNDSNTGQRSHTSHNSHPHQYHHSHHQHPGYGNRYHYYGNSHHYHGQHPTSNTIHSIPPPPPLPNQLPSPPPPHHYHSDSYNVSPNHRY